MSANVELPDEIMARIEAEAKRCQLSAADVIARLTGHLPVHVDDREMDAPAFAGAGASATGITHQIDELLADGFGRNRVCSSLAPASQPLPLGGQTDAEETK